ncbi:aromatic ring-opening dioxygenase LigA [Propionibacteriaceae bacterium G1746]|uniref:aromatic ring-opening dioxygenase LigA n=1 Tax=Aestuariimicrobium sp. G57 TaxID=3418485 RepID=UPI003C1842CD
MSSKPAKIIGILSIVAGLVMIVAGIVTWNVVTSQLKDERITVPADADKVMGMTVAGKKVEGPFTAFGQAEIIKKHALKASEGKTYAELGTDVNKAKADLEKATTDSDKQTAQAAIDKAQGQRNTVMNAAFLRSSLFSSVITYGVAALVVGLGLMFALLGYAFVSLKARPVE